jgi:signal transduction histidine kinase
MLVVEDNPGDVCLIRELLREAGGGAWSIEHAATLGEAERRLRAGAVDVALIDLGLPDARGMEAVDRVCQAHPELPVVVLTGLDATEAALEAIRSRAQDYLVKGRVDAASLQHSLRCAMERKRLEQQLRRAQRLESIGRLAGGIAHDFNNLLGVIIGHCELLELRGPEPEHHARHVECIRGAAERASALTRQLLTFSRRLPYLPEVLDVATVVSAVSQMLERLLGEHVELRIEAAPLCFVKADRAQLEQVLVNLAVNARDAMPRGGTLWIRAGARELGVPPAAGMKPGRYVGISVEDTGSGIDAGTLPYIFDPYFTTKPVGHGTGLGLATSLEIVRQSGGHIDVASEPGRGSQFTILLPACSEPPRAAAATSRGELVRGSETILFVEDDQALRDVAAEILREAGYRVLAAADGEEALRCAADDSPIDLLISDVVMPSLGGHQLWTRLRAQRPELRVLFSSGYNEEVLFQQGIAEAALPCLRKPYSTDALLSRVRASLDGPPPTAE